MAKTKKRKKPTTGPAPLNGVMIWEEEPTREERILYGEAVKVAVAVYYVDGVERRYVREVSSHAVRNALTVLAAGL